MEKNWEFTMSEFEEHLIPRRIRVVRKSMNMTAEDLAKKIDMTKAYISKLERAKKAPPISTLYRIALALDVDMNYLITGKNINYNNSKASFVKSGEQISVDGRRGKEYGYRYYALAFKKSQKLMEPFKIVVSNKEEKKPFSHPGEEFNYLIEGEVEFFLGADVYKMKPGDSLYFDSSLPHYARSTTNKDAIFLMVDVVKERLK